MKQILITFKNAKQSSYQKKMVKNTPISKNAALSNEQFLGHLIKLANFIQLNTNLCQRDKLMISHNLSRLMTKKDKITVPLCYFDEEKFVLKENPRQD